MADSLLAAVRHCCSEEPVVSLLSAPHVQAEVNKLGTSGVNALALAVWRNHAGLVEALLAAGADPDMPDTESGWSALHRALHWGQLRLAAALLQANASLSISDWRGRTPLDLLSAELKEYLEPGGDGDVFSWGNGSNYTLGTGSTDVQLHPTRLEGLHDQQIACISAAKFHSVAVSLDGRLLTWGWGRGGRLGHPDAHIHSGEGAVIAPSLVSGLGKRAVAAVAAAKHHTVLCTTAGEVFTMGSNRHGQLGYAVDTQPTPRRVTSLRQRVVAVAAANKHSVAVTASGDVYTWGSNVLGQLGYGTSDSVSNAAPRLVEAMRGKPVIAAAAAKRHTLALTAAGEVYTWGHRGVSPRRVQLAGTRDAAAADGTPIAFHRGHADVARPVAAAICAGAAHSSALTTAGVVLTWRSADPAVQVQEVGGALAGKRVISIAAGKYRTAAVSDEGDVYMWEGRSDYFPAEGRQPGSGSKKPGASSAGKARPIPGGAGGSGGMRISLGGGGASPLGGSYGAADHAGGGGGSYGSHTRRPGSFFERFAREREREAAGREAYGSSPVGGGMPGSYSAANQSGRVEVSLGSGSGVARTTDVFAQIRPERVEGLKRAVAVAVGEKHSLAIQRWSAAQLEGMAAVPWLQTAPAAVQPGAVTSAAVDEDRWYQQAADGLMDGGQLATPRALEAEPSGADSAASLSPGRPSPVRPGPRRARRAGAVGVPSLQRICEEEVARRLVDPRTCLQVLEYADVAGAEVLRAYCLAVAVCNLDAVLLEAGGAFEELPPHLLAELERLFKLRLAGAGGTGTLAGSGAPNPAASVEPVGGWRDDAQAAADQAPASIGQEAAVPGSRLHPGRRPTAAAVWLGDDGVGVADEGGEVAPGHSTGFQLASLASGGSSFRDRSQADAEEAAARLLRTLHKKLQQIDHLEAKAAAGAALDPQQQAKVQQRPVIQSAVAALESGMAVEDVHSILRAGGRELEAGGSLGLAPRGTGKAVDSAAAAAPSSSAGKQGSSRSKKGPRKSLPSQAAGHVSESRAEAVLKAPADGAGELAAGPEAAYLLAGTSPPSSSLVPVFGSVTVAAAEQPRTPVGQVRSLVGFASTSASDGVAAAAEQGGQRPSGSSTPGSSSKPKSANKRKGGLSMFLRGELEHPVAPVVPAAVESSSGSTPTPAPAWGARAAAPAGTTSLKEILDKEAAGQQQQQGSAGRPPPGPRGTPGSGVKSRGTSDSLGGPFASAAANPLRLSLANFIQSSPVAMQRRDSAASPPPAWGGATGASPPGRHTSFKAIQEEQEALLPATKAFGTSPPAVQRLGAGLSPWRPSHPHVASSAGAGSSMLSGSPSASTSLLGTSPLGRSGALFMAAPVPQQSKWYVPEESRADLRKSLRSILTEEEAMAALAKEYGSDNVRILGSKPNKATSPAAPAPKAASSTPVARLSVAAAEGAPDADPQRASTALPRLGSGGDRKLQGDRQGGGGRKRGSKEGGGGHGGQEERGGRQGSAGTGSREGSSRGSQAEGGGVRQRRGTGSSKADRGSKQGPGSMQGPGSKQGRSDRTAAESFAKQAGDGRQAGHRNRQGGRDSATGRQGNGGGGRPARDAGKQARFTAPLSEAVAAARGSEAAHPTQHVQAEISAQA